MNRTRTMTGITAHQRRTQTWLVRPLIVSAIAATPETPAPTRALAGPDTVAAPRPAHPSRHGDDRPGSSRPDDRNRADRHRPADDMSATDAAAIPFPPPPSAATPTPAVRRTAASRIAPRMVRIPNGD
ncbi:hypothetical protein OHA40_08315 [Nocardia sp. NBC_00508]|uniref:hypothetical protein n=1 Tax=Nocardia sp. NBC_00508 TaxID=2975992 RepID=UPI002E8202B5|nr:hypothetical protein [Nocardia sp. NBC_00508]WUD68106.1 hypothetical protein OHA40_08315 [Nocardia sp. NBC_00508]